MSKTSNISQMLALRIVKVTTDTDQWEILMETSIHDHVGSHGDAIH